MGYLYQRGSTLWCGYRDASGRPKQCSTGLRIGQEDAARAQLARLEGGFPAVPTVPSAPPETVAAYEAQWTTSRMERGVVSADNDSARLRLHAMPQLGHLKLVEVRPRHLRDLVRCLRAKGTFAPRTIRHIYGVLHAMFREAVADELVSTNPCVVSPHELPKAVDKDPTWRANAVFTRGELEQLLVDQRLPADRRVLYALLGLAGLRFGEAAALRWRSYDKTTAPLGRLLIASSWATGRQEETSTKTEQPRLVPVHPVLAQVLERWKDETWKETFGRAPEPDDLLIPSRRGRHRSRHHSLARFHEDLQRLLLRRRRQHDLRRTFVSLARANGARADVLASVTHGARSNSVMDMYTSMPWATVCAEVEKLEVGLNPLASAVR
ncbi:MAG: tyrosine-type recombinase/integrase [Myxococcaceae bacterium]